MRLNNLVLTIGGGILLPLLVVTVSWYPIQLLAAFLLFAFLPGYTFLVALWPDASISPMISLGKWLIAVAASYGITIVILLLLAFTRVPLNEFSVACSLGILVLLFSFIAWKQQSKRVVSTGITSKPSSAAEQVQSSHTTNQIIWLVAILLLAAFFRMANVYYSDQHGDEADILLRAVSLVFGDTESILTHSKGPGEILVLSTVSATIGRLDEQTARLPFSLAGAIGVGLVMLVGEQLFNSAAGRVAGLLAAIEGVFVSYARTAQYQSVVLMLTVAVIWCFYRFHQTGGSSRRLHALGTFLLAAAFLFHFETVLILPVVGYLTIAHLPWNGFRSLLAFPNQLKFLWRSAVIFLVVIAVFYIPFLLHPSLSQTGSYLENRIGAGSFPPFNNLDHVFYYEALKYNAAYYVALFDFFVVLAAIVALSRALKQSLVRATIYMGIVALIGLGLFLAGLLKLSALIVALGSAVFFIVVIFSPHTPIAQRTVWLWLAPPFWVYVYLVNRPGKHHYLFLGALTVLVGMIVVELWQKAADHWAGLRRPVGRWFLIGVSAVLFLVFAWHNIRVLVHSDLEYMLTYPAHKSVFYPTDSAYPYGTRIGFGYPYRIGWQVVGQLRRSGQLAGDWAGNDEGDAPNWYMLAEPPSPCYPRFVLHGEVTFKGDENLDVPFDPAKFGYIPRYRIWGNDQLRMTILEFDPLANNTEPQDLYEPARFDQPVTAADFAATLSKPQGNLSSPQVLLEPSLGLGEGSELKNNAPPEYQSRAQQLDGMVALSGYDLDERYAQPGGIVPITLYWNAQNPLSLRYKVFVHVISPEGQLLTQADDFPVCGTFHANTWPVNQTVLDRHLLKIPADAAPGDYTLVVGMYEPELNLRLNYFDVAGKEQGNSLNIGTLTIRPE